MRIKWHSGYYKGEMEWYSVMHNWLGVQEAILRYTIARCREFRRPWKKKEWFEKVKRCHRTWQEGRSLERIEREYEKWKTTKYT